MKVQLMVVELFAFLLTVLTYEIFISRFVTSERNLATLVKGNHLSLLSESCSAGSELSESQFS